MIAYNSRRRILDKQYGIAKFMKWKLSWGYQMLTEVNTEDGGDSFLRNFDNHLQDYTTSQPRRQQQTPSRQFSEANTSAATSEYT
jgi:hypothetical protein